jgi:[ribosomal protein S5]-alanine N-acetyltransferase
VNYTSNNLRGSSAMTIPMVNNAMDNTVPTRTELHTERLLLRPFQEQDVADGLAYRNDAEFARYLPRLPQPSTLQDAEAWVARNMSEPWERLPTFAVVLDDRLIGDVNFNVDSETKTAMLGYSFGRQWWGRGIATEAAQAAITWATQAFGLIRIWASTDARNVRSQRVLEKLGFQREGVRVADGVGRDGELTDTVMYGLDLK